MSLILTLVHHSFTLNNVDVDNCFSKYWNSTGLTVKLGKYMSVDLAAAYLQGEEVSFTELDNNTGITYAFTNKAEAVVGSAQFNMLF